MKRNYYLIFIIPFSFFYSCYPIPISEKKIGNQNTVLFYNESPNIHMKKEKPRVNIEGAEITLVKKKILDRSLMPSGLYETMPGVEFRDLIQFLSERTSTKINSKQK